MVVVLLDWNQVKLGGVIDDHKSALVEQFHFKIANDVALAVDQLGTRKGAIAVYLSQGTWILDLST